MKKEKKFLLIIILLILTCLLRLPSLFEPHWYGDEGITLTVGQQLRRGLTLYKDVADNKTPLLYFLAAKAVTLFNFKLLTFFWVLTTLFCFLKLASKLTPKRKILAIIVFIFLTSTPILEGNIINGEIFAILPMIISVYLFWQKNYFLCGILASISFLFKHPFLFDFLSLPVFLIFFNQDSYKKLFLKMSKLTAGFLLPLSFISIYFYHQGALIDFIDHAFLNNLKYISWQTEIIMPQGLILIKTLILLLFIIVAYKKKKELTKKEAFISLWLSFSLFGTTLSTRSYSHYLLQVVPPFSLMIGMSLNFIKIFLIILLLTVNIFQFKLDFDSFHYLLSYYQNFLRGNSYHFYGDDVETTYEIADFLRRNAKFNEPIFVWSNNSSIYALSQRKPAGKYIAAYHIKTDPNREKETIKDLTGQKPRFIVVTLPIKHQFLELAALLAEEYNLIREKTDYQIYEIKN